AARDRRRSVAGARASARGHQEIHRMSASCTHLDLVRTDEPSSDGCEECLKTGDSWVHLRLCRTCGHVGCCDESKNKHATKHFNAAKHPIITSLESGEDWSWCYVDEVAVELK